MKSKNKTFNLNVIYKNIPGKGTGTKYKSKKAWFSSNLKHDIICIQEVKSKIHKACLEWFPIGWHDQVYTSLMKDTTNAQGGVMIALNPHSGLKVINTVEIKGTEGRVLALEVKWKDFFKFTIVNLYLPSGNDKKTIKERNAIIDKIKNNKQIQKAKNLLIGGDWNSIRHADDSTNPNYNMESAPHLEQLENELALYDLVKAEQVNNDLDDEEPTKCNFTRCSMARNLEESQFGANL